MIFDENITKSLWNSEKSICFFILDNQYFWIIDYKYNFDLDAELDFKAYREKGHITDLQYYEACKTFRGGLLKLTSGNFNKYIQNEGVKILDSTSLIKYFWSFIKENEINKLASEIRNNHAEKPSKYIFLFANQLKSRLPLFYINFDTKTYLHMDWDRCHEDLVYPDWTAKAENFEALIPEEEKYWVKNGMNIWQLLHPNSSNESPT